MSKSSLSPKLLQVLICPITRKPLQYDKDNAQLVSASAGLCFPISHNIPLLVEELALPIHSEDENVL